MNAKYAVALILALQVSMSLCELPTPSTEMVEKYDSLKTTFLKRLNNFWDKVAIKWAEVVAPYEDNPTVQQVATTATNVRENPNFKAFVSVVKSMRDNSGEVGTTIRETVLGLYEKYLRPTAGADLDKIVNQIKTYLDISMPVE